MAPRWPASSSSARRRAWDCCRSRPYSTSPSKPALAWLLRQDGVTAPIIGPRTLEQLDGTLGALEVELDEAALRRIDEIFPGPGPAPEAYAW